MGGRPLLLGSVKGATYAAPRLLSLRSVSGDWFYYNLLCLHRAVLRRPQGPQGVVSPPPRTNCSPPQLLHALTFPPRNATNLTVTGWSWRFCRCSAQDTPETPPEHSSDNETFVLKKVRDKRQKTDARFAPQLVTFSAAGKHLIKQFHTAQAHLGPPFAPTEEGDTHQ
eukprot:1173151-Prorocentrum_minimum.AAC.1